MRGRDKEREDFALFSSLSFPSFSTVLLLAFCVILMTIAIEVAAFSGSDGVVASTPPRVQTVKVFPCRKIVVLTLNYCLILENAIGNDFCFFLIVPMNWLSKAKVCNKNNLSFVHPNGINHYDHTHTYPCM
jgi:hypothetical protein